MPLRLRLNKRVLRPKTLPGGRGAPRPNKPYVQPHEHDVLRGQDGQFVEVY